MKSDDNVSLIRFVPSLLLDSAVLQLYGAKNKVASPLVRRMRPELSRAVELRPRDRQRG